MMSQYISIAELYELFKYCNQKITTDTRKLDNGAIFFALRGDNFNANTFAQNAIDTGCSFAIVDDERFCNGLTILLVPNVLKALQDLANHHRHQLNIPIIGITGSNGKTTNKELIHAVLSKKYKTYATKGNLNNHIGVPLSLLEINYDHEIAIIEMGANHKGEIERLCNIAEPTYGLITNIGLAHLEGFGGIEGVKIGKSELYGHIKSKNGKIFINGNDDVLIQLSCTLSKIYYGSNDVFDIHGEIQGATECVEFKWNTSKKVLLNQPIVKTNMFGAYNFINLLCAACIGNYFKVGEEDINKALSSYIPEMNRSQVKKTALNTIILDAYNANPSSMTLAIDNFSHQVFANKVVVIGDMLELGEFSDDEHKKIALQLQNSEIKNVLLVGPHFFKLKNDFNYFHFFATISDLKMHLTKVQIHSSTLLIKGSRGMKLEQIVDLL